MNDAISRSAAIEALNQHSYETFSDYNTTVELLNELPSIDAVPVVRCKDCKYRFTLDCPMRHEELTYDEDDGYDWIDHDYTSDDRFCNEGARTDGEADG